MKNGFKKIALLLSIGVIAMNLSGCETLKKKFIRKQSPKKVSPVLVPQDYRGIYPNDILYSNHFNYWRTWTEDLINCLDTKASNKREKLAAARAVEDLERMQDLLTGDKEDKAYILKEEETVKPIRTTEQTLPPTGKVLAEETLPRSGGTLPKK